MKRHAQITRIGGLAVLACAGMLALSAAPAAADLCPPGDASNPIYCKSVRAQTIVIEQSADSIISSYFRILHSAQSICKRVTSSAVIKRCNSLFAKAAALIKKAQKLLSEPTTDKTENTESAYAERAEASLARKDAALARLYVAEARQIAAIEVVTERGG